MLPLILRVEKVFVSMCTLYSVCIVTSIKNYKPTGGCTNAKKLLFLPTQPR